MILGIKNNMNREFKILNIRKHCKYLESIFRKTWKFDVLGESDNCNNFSSATGQHVILGY